jgi:hypothetical protein
LIGPTIICNTMSSPRLFPKAPKRDEPQFPWQYHSRSDDHSNVAAVAVTIDLMLESPELRQDIEAGLIGFQVNPVLKSRSDTAKTLDLSIGVIDDAQPMSKTRSLTSMLEEMGGVLSDDEWKILSGLPRLRESRAKQKLVVLENKACMTAHGKAGPRLKNELEGAVDAIYKSDANTVAGGLVIVNAAATFVSPVFKNNSELSPDQRRPTFHNQPEDAARTIQRLKDIQLRQPGGRQDGYDALGILVVNAPNDCTTPWTLVDDPKFSVPKKGEIHNYVDFIQHLATQYRIRGFVSGRLK